MPTFSNPFGSILKPQYLTTKFNRQYFLDTVNQAEIAALEEIEPDVRALIEQLFGTRHFSLEELRRMGHPYSTRFDPGKAGFPDFIINYQSGRFFNAFSYSYLYRTNKVILKVENSDVKQVVLEKGTDKMRSRPWRLALSYIFHSQLTNKVNNSLRKAVNVRFKSNRGLTVKYNEGIAVLGSNGQALEMSE